MLPHICGPSRTPVPTACVLISLTKYGTLGYNARVKGEEEKSTREGTVREPCQVRVGTVDTGEHGLGAELSILRQLRERPLTRFEAYATLYQIGRTVEDAGPYKAKVGVCESRWYHGNFYRPCVCRGDFYL